MTWWWWWSMWMLTMPSTGVASLMVDMIQAAQPLVLECIFASLNNALMTIQCGQLQSMLYGRCDGSSSTEAELTACKTLIYLVQQYLAPFYLPFSVLPAPWQMIPSSSLDDPANFDSLSWSNSWFEWIVSTWNLLSNFLYSMFHGCIWQLCFTGLYRSAAVSIHGRCDLVWMHRWKSKSIFDKIDVRCTPR